MKDYNVIIDALQNGFNCEYPKGKLFNVHAGWFGVTSQHPDARISKGDKSIVLSLQGITSLPIPEEFEHLAKSMSIKYISLRDGDKVIYQSWTGQLPEKEMVESFINN